MIIFFISGCVHGPLLSGYELKTLDQDGSQFAFQRTIRWPTASMVGTFPLVDTGCGPAPSATLPFTNERREKKSRKGSEGVRRKNEHDGIMSQKMCDLKKCLAFHVCPWNSILSPSLSSWEQICSSLLAQEVSDIIPFLPLKSPYLTIFIELCAHTSVCGTILSGAWMHSVNRHVIYMYQKVTSTLNYVFANTKF